MRAWRRRQEDCRSDEDSASVRKNDGCASAVCSRMKEGTTRWRVRKSPWSTRTHDSVARQIRRMGAIAAGVNHQKTNCSRDCSERQHVVDSLALQGEKEKTKNVREQERGRPGHGESDQLRTGWKTRTAGDNCAPKD